ncbi:MAG: abortive infection family protein [Candidatus Omnitrophica bacterium]|nr:abortive infection family protein [Candidatus Omnitrophota bacterium]
MVLNFFETEYERGEYFQNLLIAHATGGHGDQSDYEVLRRHFLNNLNTKDFVPRFVRTSRDLSQFWQFIKAKFAHYADRRQFLWDEFRPLLDYLESGAHTPAEKPISDTLQKFDQDNVHRAWTRASERKSRDPEGAITAARTLLEAVCKHILDECGIKYPKNVDLHQLYTHTAKELNLSPDQHNKQIFKQILGGCSGIVNGLGALRNVFGDAHGRGKLSIRPASRHAELAVNLAGAVAVFLVTTFEDKKAGRSTR